MRSAAVPFPVILESAGSAKEGGAFSFFFHFLFFFHVSFSGAVKQVDTVMLSM